MARLCLRVLITVSLALLGTQTAVASTIGADALGAHDHAIDPTAHGDAAHWSWVGTPDTDAPTVTSVSYFLHSGAHGGAAMTAPQVADMHAAVATFNASGANVNLTLAASDATADIHMHMDTTSLCGAGALGCAAFGYFGHGLSYSDTHPQHKMASNTAFPGIQTLTMYDDSTFGGSWYSGAAGGIPGGDFDFLTVAIQEVGHHLGLEHNDSGSGHGDFGSSPLNGLLSPGDATRRALTGSDTAALVHLYGIIPEPSTLTLTVLGVAGLVVSRRRRN